MCKLELKNIYDKKAEGAKIHSKCEWYQYGEKPTKSSNQTAYVKNQCISESGRLISDVTEMCDILDIPGYLIIMDIEKAFDSLNHDFLLSILKKFGFGENFMHWIKVLLNNQQSSVINGGFKTPYFNLEKGAR